MGHVKLLHTSDWHLGRTLIQAEPARGAAAVPRLAARDRARRERGRRRAGLRRRLRPRGAHRSTAMTAARPHARGASPRPASRSSSSAATTTPPYALGFGSGCTSAPASTCAPRVATIDRARRAQPTSHGEVAVYGIPYLLPDAADEELGAERSHEAVLLGGDRSRILADAASPRHRAHGGAGPRVRHRRARPASPSATSAWAASATPRPQVFDGAQLRRARPPAPAAGGHARRQLHGAALQRLAAGVLLLREATTPSRSRSSSSAPTGVAAVAVRRHARARGRCARSAARSTTCSRAPQGDLAELADGWVKVVLTDPAARCRPWSGCASTGRTPWCSGFEPRRRG